MEYFLSGLKEALALLFPPRREIVEIVGLSLLVSCSATLLASCIAVPTALALALSRFRAKRFVVGLLQSMLSIPAVLIGLVVYILLSRRGLFGFLHLLYTPGAMIAAQALLAAPLITALTLSALKTSAQESRQLAYSLGASRGQMLWTLLYQGRFAFFTAVITGFSRVIGETGMTLMVGGNIRGETRVMTTAISLETMKGNFEIGLALGLVLLVVALLLNALMQLGQGR